MSVINPFLGGSVAESVLKPGKAVSRGCLRQQQRGRRRRPLDLAPAGMIAR